MADPGAAVTVQAPPARLPGSDLAHRLAAVSSQVVTACQRAGELRQRIERVQAETTALRQAMASAREGTRQRRSVNARPQPLPRPTYAQMAAWSQTMPVIEQAKGIIMAQSRCRPAEAFETLRRASQQSNVPVREVAAQIVATVTG